MSILKKQWRIIAVAIFTTIMLVGCADEPEPQPGGGEQVVIGGAEDDTVYFGVDRERELGDLDGVAGSAVKKGEYNGYLGLGYDVINDPFWDTYFVKKRNPVLDIDKIIADGKVYVEPNATSSTVIASGESISKYAQSLASKVGLDAAMKGVFSASISLDFTVGQKYESTSSFVKHRSIINKQEHYMSKVSINQLRKDYLDEDFKNDLMDERKSADELFGTYGTHVFTHLIMGGRLEMNYEVYKTSQEDLFEIETKVKGGNDIVTGHASVKDSSTKATFKNGSSCTINAYGGPYTIKTTSLAAAVDGYDRWTSGLDTKTDLAIVSGGSFDQSRNDLIEIWRLIDTVGSKSAKTRYDKIKNRYDTLLAKKGSWINGLQDTRDVPKPTYIDSVYMGYGSSAFAAEGHLRAQNAAVTIVSGGLNKGVGGNYIFLGYTTTTDSTKAIRNIDVSYETHAPSTYTNTNGTKDGAKYTWFGVDADRGVALGCSDACIWLYYTKSKSAGKPIKDLKVEISGSEGIAAPKGTDWIIAHSGSGKDAKQYNLNSCGFVRSAYLCKYGCKTKIYLWMQK